jgi:hypothetical protein
MTTKFTGAGLAAVAALALSFAGCGDNGGGGASKRTAAPSAPKPAERSAPADLVGTYSMTLERGDLPSNPPRELTDQAERWTLKISNTGGPDNAPALTLINDKLGTLESSRFGVIGERILLHEEECAVGPALVESEYAWKRSAKTLRFIAAKNGCKDKVALTLLTAEPWTKRP